MFHEKILSREKEFKGLISARTDYMTQQNKLYSWSACSLQKPHRTLDICREAAANVNSHSIWVNLETQHIYITGERDSLLVRVPDSWSKGCEFKSRQEWRENFLLQSQICVLTLILCPFHPHVTAVARKRPRSFCPKCRWQVTHKHAYILDPSKSE